MTRAEDVKDEPAGSSPSKKRGLLIAMLGLLILIGWAGLSRSFVIPIRRLKRVAPPIVGIVERERLNGPREVLKSRMVYKRRMLPALKRRGVSCPEYLWFYFAPVIYLGEDTAIILIPMFLRSDAEAIRDAASRGIADFEFQNED